MASTEHQSREQAQDALQEPGPAASKETESEQVLDGTGTVQKAEEEEEEEEEPQPAPAAHARPVKQEKAFRGDRKTRDEDRKNAKAQGDAQHLVDQIVSDLPHLYDKYRSTRQARQLAGAKRELLQHLHDELDALVQDVNAFDRDYVSPADS